ncbi:MAG: crotonase/enoyl-CoA hydratase family protein [Desulfobacteraceae bacterium]|jgi:enoyl-CoA hydratase
MSDKNLFKVAKDGNIAWLTFDRPEKRNSMNLEFFQGLIQHFTGFDQDPEVRVVIVKAEGESFTAGIDLFAMGTLLQGEGAAFREELRNKIVQLQDSMNTIERCRKPVIAAVHSHCIGGGVDLLSACDIRMASRDAVFAIRETRIAIIADLGTLQRLPYIIGQGWFRELALTGRNFSADEALKMGFITRLFEDRQTLYQEARKVALEIAECSPLAVQGVKEVINYSRDHGVYPGLEYVAQKNAALLPSEDLTEAFKAFVEKRPPKFKGK